MARKLITFGFLIACVCTLAACVQPWRTETLSEIMYAERFLTVDGIDLHYTDSAPTGSPVGTPTLVLVHGFAASLHTWDDIAPHLERNYRVVRVDLKGSGLSSKPVDNRYHVRDQAALLSEFIIRLNLTDVVLIGHSYGGAVSILTYYHLRDRDSHRILGLVLIDSAGFPQEYPFQVEAYRNPLVRFMLSAFTSPRWRAEYGLRRIFHNDAIVTPDRITKYAYFYTLPGSHHALTEVARQMDSADSKSITGELGTVTVPVLLLWGEKDRVIPLSSGRQFVQSIPRAVLKTIPDAGHVPHEEFPSLVNAHLDSFLTALK